MSLRIVVLTLENRYGMRVLKALQERDVVPDAIVIYAGLGWDDCLCSRKGGARWSHVPRALLRWGWRRLRFRLLRRRHYRPFAKRVVPSGSLRSVQLLRDLKRLQPDVLVLGSSRIVSQEIIDTARLGVLNAHPGVLPWVRGVDSDAHALMVGVPIGATCHLVDGRIDTGALIERRLLPIEGDTTLAQLETENSAMAAGLLGDVVAQTLALGAFPKSVRQEVRFPLCKRQTAEQRQASLLVAQTGRPRELFEQWSTLCHNRETWALPPDPFVPPVKPSLTPLDVTW